MWKICRKYKKKILLSFILLVVYTATRLIHLTTPLLYNDEPIYFRFAQIELKEPYHWLISLSVGRQPLFIWAVSGMMLLFHNPVLAGRLVSVVCGFLTLTGRRITSKNV